MPAFVHLEEGAQQHHQFRLSDAFSSVAGFSFWLSSTPPRIEPVGSLPHRADHRGRPKWSVPEAGLAPSASGECALRPSGVAIVCAPNGTLAEMEEVPANSCRRSGRGRSAGYDTLQLVDIGLVGASQQHIHAVFIVAVFRRAVD